MNSAKKADESTKELLGEILIKRGLINQEQLKEALLIQETEKGFLGEILIKRGYVQERDIVVALIVQCGLPYVAIDKYKIAPEILKLIPAAKAKEFCVMPLDCVGDVVSVVMANPLSEAIKKEIEKMTQRKVTAFIATKREIEQAIAHWYAEDV